MFQEYIDSQKDNLLKDLEKMIKIPSKLESYDNKEYPFGKEVDNALNEFLNIAKSMGFRTKNVDKYCGYVEFGEGDELVGIVGHLDVVPEGEGWTYPPFEMTIEDGKIYGRGTTDDKGPVMASLYAMKAVMEIGKIHKRVRLIVGLNEENDWKCIKHYKEVEEIPTIGFSPDADFPCIYSEKALLTVWTENKYEENELITIKQIDCKDNRVNVVPKFCEVKLQVNNTILNEVKEFFKTKLSDEFSFTVNDNTFFIKTKGIQAHAAHPELGKNAISHMILILNELFNRFEIEELTIRKLASKIRNETNGESLGIAHKNEELGDLTLNLARLDLENGTLKSAMNLRIPGDIEIKDIKEKIQSSFSDLKVIFRDEKQALYIPKDNELVIKLCKIYNDYMCENKKPLAIGGATFARAFQNCVSFGAMNPEEPDMCHQVDEYITLENLINSCNMYAIAIYELARQ